VSRVLTYLVKLGGNLVEVVVNIAEIAGKLERELCSKLTELSPNDWEVGTVRTNSSWLGANMNNAFKYINFLQKGARANQDTVDSEVCELNLLFTM